MSRLDRASLHSRMLVTRIAEFNATPKKINMGRNKVRHPFVRPIYLVALILTIVAFLVTMAGD